MLKQLILPLACILSTPAFAATDYYVGNSGQYHTLPVEENTQEITLTAEQIGPCAAQNAMTFYAVNEFGKEESVPFTVPGRTVFLLKDVAFVGSDSGGIHPGLTPWLNVGQIGGQMPKLSVPADRPLSGVAGEKFVGHGSLESGGAFAIGSVLCANAAYGPVLTGVVGDGSYAVNNVVAHGTLITNVRTNTYPYLDW